MIFELARFDLARSIHCFLRYDVDETILIFTVSSCQDTHPGVDAQSVRVDEVTVVSQFLCHVVIFDFPTGERQRKSGIDFLQTYILTRALRITEKKGSIHKPVFRTSFFQYECNPQRSQCMHR